MIAVMEEEVGGGLGWVGGRKGSYRGNGGAVKQGEGHD